MEKTRLQRIKRTRDHGDRSDRSARGWTKVRNEGTPLLRRTVVVSHGKKIPTPVLVDHAAWSEMVE